MGHRETAPLSLDGRGAGERVNQFNAANSNQS
jgi:hypothetical protein